MRLSTSMIVAAAVVVGLPCVAAAQDAARGEQVYAAQRCQGCHMVGGKGNKNNPLDGVGARLPAADIKEWVVDPVAAAAKHKSTKKPLMPKTYAKLPTADIDALVVYMHSLK